MCQIVGYFSYLFFKILLLGHHKINQIWITMGLEMEQFIYITATKMEEFKNINRFVFHSTERLSRFFALKVFYLARRFLDPLDPRKTDMIQINIERSKALCLLIRFLSFGVKLIAVIPTILFCAML